MLKLLLASPGFWLAVLLAGAATFVSGVWTGVHWEQGNHARDVSIAQQAAIDGANQRGDADTKLFLAQAAKERDARVISRTAKLAGELDAIKKSRPGCARDDTSLSLLSAAIDTANGQAPTAAAVSSVVRLPAKTGGWFGAVTPAMGISADRAVRPVP